MTTSQIPTRLGSSRVHGGRIRRVGIWGVGCGVLLALSANACAKARAETVPDGPPLQMPQPPQRVLAPVEEAVIAAPAPEPEGPPAAAASRTPPRAASDQRPQPAPPAAAQALPQTPAAEGRELRTGSSPANAATERSVRDTLARALRDISRVNYGRLSAEGRAQHEQSKRFSAQAEQALKERNFNFAATLADKAATLAADLLGR